ncbi:hypothetical protein GQ53DRAFT_805127 [Thozetella sp. PMI_491]|nr:hypothetical protein GQ53DRAFT_805127 [Thozetella sp. PMI_491]
MANTAVLEPIERLVQPRRPGLKIRRYGWNDFEKFDEESARGSHVCVGSADIGKVEVDCRYNWRKTQWGVLGPDRNPAGTVYMDLSFKQPTGYKLDSATVIITLSDNDPTRPGKHSRHKKQSRSSLRSAYAVQMTEYFGPHFLAGAKTVVPTTKTHNFTPSVGAMGFQVGGVGMKSSSYRQEVARWSFRGTVLRAKDGDGFRTLEWELSENHLDQQQTHSHVYHTAFAFEHSKRPVFMRVQVQGRLRSKTRDIKHQMLRFSSSIGSKDNSTITEIQITQDLGLFKRLDEIAAGLDMAMQQENYRDMPLEIPDTLPATFVSESAPTAPADDSPLLAEETTEETATSDPVIEYLVGQLGSGAYDGQFAPAHSSTLANIPAPVPLTRRRVRDRERVANPIAKQEEEYPAVPAILGILRMLAAILRFLGPKYAGKPQRQQLRWSETESTLKDPVDDLYSQMADSFSHDREDRDVLPARVTGAFPGVGDLKTRRRRQFLEVAASINDWNASSSETLGSVNTDN